MLLQQTALSEKKYKSALKLHGGFVSLGEGLNLIRKKDNAKILTIDLDFYNGKIFEELREEYFTNFCQDFFYFATIMEKLYGKKHYSKRATIFDRLKKLYNTEVDLDIRFMRMSSKEISEKFDKATFYDLVNHTYELISKVDAKDFPEELKMISYIIGMSAYRMRGGVNHFNTLKDRKDEYLLTFDFLEGITRDIKKWDILILLMISQ